MHERYMVEYYHPRVRKTILNWPVGVLAAYSHLVELLMDFGPDLRLPHSRALGGGLFELRPRGKEGIGRAMYAFLRGRRIVIVHSFLKKTRTAPKKELEIARQRIREINREINHG